jgi:hypothetical protein
MGNKMTLFAHAVSETVRANRGYRTYTITIPMRPELKLGFPVFIPHKDMYAYIKSISVQYTVGGTATMTLTCDSLRRRVMINTPQTLGSGNSTLPQSLYTSAPNLVIQWTKNSPNPTVPDPSQSPSLANFNQNTGQLLSQGQNGGVSRSGQNITNPVGQSQTLLHPATNPDGSKFEAPPENLKIYSNQSTNVASTASMQTDSRYATYVVKNDGNKAQGTIDPKTGQGFFTQKRIVDLSYLQALQGNPTTMANSTIPYTDDKGYEVMAPFPWGRWLDLNTVIRQVTEQGWITPPTDANGNFTEDLEEEATLQNAQAFLFAGLGTPTTTNDPPTQLITALNQNTALVGGSLIGNSNNITQPTQSGATNPVTGQSTTNTNPTVNSTTGNVPQQPDATVIILHYDASQPGSFASNSLLNAQQPENAFAEAQLKATQSGMQQLVNVLVSGSVAPTPAVQEALLATQTQLPNGNITLISHPPAGS